MENEGGQLVELGLVTLKKLPLEGSCTACLMSRAEHPMDCSSMENLAPSRFWYLAAHDGAFSFNVADSAQVLSSN
jgi:hypothetical protein